jgi:hypothetical protein
MDSNVTMAIVAVAQALVRAPTVAVLAGERAAGRSSAANESWYYVAALTAAAEQQEAAAAG